MFSVDDAFKKFKSRLELNDKEQANAKDRHKEVREYIETKFKIDRSFLTGSYARWTKTKPLKDIDIFFVMKPSENHYRDKGPAVILDDFYLALVDRYGRDNTKRQNRSINVDFGIRADESDKTDYKVISIDVVPAFDKGTDYEIPDDSLGKWIGTNPQTHAQKAVEAQQAYSSEWKGLVRMIKYWNNNPRHGEKPVKPSFLIEVMCLQCLHAPWGGAFDREVQALFSTLADRVHETWADPAGLGPPISDGMDTARKDRAERLLRQASRDASLAIDLRRRGKNGEAVKAWRELFGPRYPLS
ncbi:CBASS oligonucleotide cyclase [Methylobacterium sp. NEAU K]|uniref:CBASS oligonucleotide cyclase n=1 Tax=Methylobacterium sp. NEAU K TaxID=3064946 RepID=UPI0027333EAF|nr:CBASS oligonucleotide cyclase [Methylobacterium sp. NEAU K]MDP4003651.1 CBASS oligonucleotide cyclase [Methylobacterium sp. NEAU K]